MKNLAEEMAIAITTMDVLLKDTDKKYPDSYLESEVNRLLKEYREEALNRKGPVDG